MKEQLNRVLVPVLLGDGGRAFSIARGLYRRFGVISHLYCTRPRFFWHLLSFVRVVRIPAFMQGDLLCTDLRSFAAEYPDLLFCLVPCTEQYVVFCAAHAADLEAYYVIAQPEQFDAGCLPHLKKEELPV